MADFTDYVVLDDVADAFEYADSGIELAPVDWTDVEVLEFAGVPILGLFYNRVYDATAVSFVTWTSNGGPDATGLFYPGPGVFGVDTSDYVTWATR